MNMVIFAAALIKPFHHFLACALKASITLSKSLYGFSIVLYRFLCFHFKSLYDLSVVIYRFILFHISPFWTQLCYFIATSFLGFLALKALAMRGHTAADSRRRGSEDLDMLFMAVSAVTVSSMSTVEMESFSNSQLLVFTFLMLFGGDVFTSMLGLQFSRLKSKKKLDRACIELTGSKVVDRTDLGSNESGTMELDMALRLRLNSIKYLGFLVLGYLVLVHASGCTFIMLYLSLFPSARAVLEGKKIHAYIFSVFTTVSSISNGGFIPTNESMMVFRDCSGLLLSTAALVLLGNTMYSPSLRLVIWVLKRFSKRRSEFDCMLEDCGELRYDHLLPRRRSMLLALTVAGFVLVQFTLFCCMEWRSEGLEGMTSYQKVVGALFMSVNSRHAGESIVDISTVSPAILLLFMVMMYLPPYTSFCPIENGDGISRNQDGSKEQHHQKKSSSLAKNLIFSQLSNLAIFTMIICITERRRLSEDPLNFNVFNIAFEVVSAYGNVGFTMGYSCKRQLKPDLHCKDTWYGFVGRWSTKGKLTLIVVMLFGKLKKFIMTGGEAWKLQ